MNKSLYPLMLSDDVVAAVDRLAYERGTNRSNMINQILAEYVSYTTPEMRMHDIFTELRRLLTGRDSFQVLLPGSGSVFSLRSALAYKYNPNVRYTVELYRAPADGLGELRVSLRTQSSSLILYLTQFYKLFIKIEAASHPGCRYRLDGGKLSRLLRLDDPRAKTLSEEEIGSQIADLILAFDRALKAFFYCLDAPSEAARRIELIYREYYENSKALI